MMKRMAIVGGIRTAMGKAGGALKETSADDLGAYVVRDVVAHSGVDPQLIDEVIVGNVAQPADAANIARVIALKAGLPKDIIAHTVHRNCASGMQAITTAANQIACGQSEIVVAAGAESMSQIPLLYSRPMTDLFAGLMKAKTWSQKLTVLARFRPAYLKPIIGVVQGLTDPVCGLNMGQTAEVLSKEFHVTREEQDAYALESHRRAIAAMESGRMAEEILPIPLAPQFDRMYAVDEGPRARLTMEDLQKLKPYFDRNTGTVTVGNACPITDGAAAVMVMSEEKAKSLGLTPLGYLRGYAYASLEPERMGLGPVYATAKLLKQMKWNLADFGLVELNEAFAAQVLACLKAFESDAFAEQYLGQSKALGTVDRNILNVNGGAIALGHPVGMTGCRLVITLLKEMKRRNQSLGLATLCIGGGQGAALALEVE